MRLSQMLRSPDQECTCGHPRVMHEHYRGGSDCGHCGAGGCAKFRRAWAWRPAADPVTEPMRMLSRDEPVDLGDFARRKDDYANVVYITRKAG